MEKDLNSLRQMMTKIAVETALNVELDEYLRDVKHQEFNQISRRNGFTRKILTTEGGRFEVDIPRDRDSRFQPQLIEW